MASDTACGPGAQDHGGNRREAQEHFGVGELLDFSASINPLGYPPGLRRQLDGAWAQILHYPDRHCSEFRAAVAREFALPPETVAVGNGSAELIDLLLRALSPRRLLLSPPDFGLYASLAPPGCPLVDTARREAAGFAPDLARLGEMVRPGDAVLLSNPGNPSGHAVPAAAWDDLLEQIARAPAHLILDEAFADFCPQVSMLPAVPDHPRLVVLRSLTKFYGIPGLRLGFLAGTPELVHRVEGLQVPWSVGTLAQAAGVACLQAPGWAAATLEYVARRRGELSRGLAALPGLTPLPSAANYLLVRLDPPAPTARRLYDALGRQGILVRHCGSFGLGERYLRVAVRTPAENARLLAALAAVLTSSAGQATRDRAAAAACG